MKIGPVFSSRPDTFFCDSLTPMCFPSSSTLVAMQERSRKKTNILGLLGNKIISFFEWLCSFIFSKKEKVPEYEYQKLLGEKDSISYRLVHKGKETESSVQFSLRTASLNGLTISDGSIPSAVGKMIVGAMKNEKIDQLRVHYLGQARNLWKAGLRTDADISFSTGRGGTWNVFALEVLKEVLSKKSGLSSKEESAVLSIQDSLVRGVIQEIDLAPEKSLKKIQALEALFGISFDLQALKGQAEKKKEEWLETALSEILSLTRGSIQRAFKGDLSIKLEDFFCLLEAIDKKLNPHLRAMKISDTIFKLKNAS